MLDVGVRVIAWMSGCSDDPESVDAVKNRYLPLRSQTGSPASLIPSVTWVALPSASEYTCTALM